VSIQEPSSPEANCAGANCQQIKFIITPKEKDLGGFSVRRLLPALQQRMVGPWLFFDHMGPAKFKAGEGINVRPHPHINLATVTYLFEGEILHRDSLGSYQPIRPGDVNLMVAGKGIVNSVDHALHGLQLWLALPKDKQEIDPDFIHYPDKEIPQINVEGVPVKIIMGEAYGAISPVKLFADTLYIEAALREGQRLTLPIAEERALYVAAGQVSVQGNTLSQYQMAILGEHTDIQVIATADARIALIGGEAMEPRHMFWNFASTSKERIEQAKQDWIAQRFDKVPGDEDEFIPLPSP
jgi:redox-sensitive bicupin YhaK (pirin superfamily)